MNADGRQTGRAALEADSKPDVSLSREIERQLAALAIADFDGLGSVAAAALARRLIRQSANTQKGTS